MEFPPKFNFKMSTAWKIAGLALVAVIITALAFRLIGSSINSVTRSPLSAGISQSAPAYDSTGNYGGAKYGESADNAYPGLSARNVSPTPSPVPPAEGGITTGDQDEEFEVTEYGATVETRQLEDSCSLIAGLKARDDVIFSSAGEYDKGCNYSFKVKRDKAAEILAIIKGMNPKNLSESTYTIKSLIEDFTSETEILEKKLASVDETLSRAVGAYDEVTVLATKVKDVESLARVIDSKINVIERLTQERLNISAQLEQIGRAKSEQLDRLAYTNFNVSIYENKFIDWKEIKDSWKAAVKEFFSDVNRIAQDVTVSLAMLLLTIFQYAIYAVILMIVAKYGWKLVKYLWKR